MLKRYIKHVKECWRQHNWYGKMRWRSFFYFANPIRFYRYETDPLIVAARQRAKRPTTPCRSLDTSPEAVSSYKTYNYLPYKD